MIIIAIAMVAGEPSDYFPHYSNMSESSKEAVAPYWNCALEKADAFELSGQPISDLVPASLTACQSERIELEASLATDAAEAAVDAMDDQYGLKTVPDSSELMREFDERLAAEVRLRLVETRARKAKINAPNN